MMGAGVSEALEPLGDFLRSRRERLRPAQVGLSDTRRRRTPGLRREEVASLAGISAEWYVKLEQGRAVAPSASTVDALARALRLNESEHAHLRALASRGHLSTYVSETVPDTLRRLIDSLPHPAYVTGLRWDVLAWNEATAALFDDLNQLAVEDRNILHYVLTNPSGRLLFGNDWAIEARRMVSLFRATYDLRRDDPAFIDLVGQLREGCPEFKDWWIAHEVATPESGTKVLWHPHRGAIRFDFATLQANDDPRLKLVAYLPR